MIALVGAMFVAFPLSRAAVGDTVGDVDANGGFCVQTDGANTADDTTDDVYHVNSELDGSGDTVMVYHPDNTNDADTTTEGDQPDAGDEPDPVALTCAATQLGQPVKITPNGTITPIIEALAPSVSISFGDSDAMVKADSELTVTVKLANFESASIDASAAPQVNWVRVSGVLDGTEANSVDIDIADGRGETAAGYGTIIVPDGTAPGDYTVSAEVLFDLTAAGGEADADDTDPAIGSNAKERIRASKTFTVSDIGVNAASATLSLGNEDEDDPGTTLNERKPETGTTPASGDIWLKIEVSNSAGNKANGNGLNTITVIAPGAVLAFHAPTVTGAPAEVALEATTAGVGALSGGTNSISISDDTVASTTDIVGQTMFVKVTKAGSPPKAGSITVYALVIGTDGAPRTNDVELAFTGTAAQVALGDDVSVGKPAEGEVAKAEISLGATDAGGNKAALGTVIYKVTDADGEAVSQSLVKAETNIKGSSTDDKDTDDNKNVNVVLVTVDDTADPGVYTIEASLSGVDDSSDTATVTVSGAAASVDLSADKSTSDTIGDVITVTAVIADADGHAIADGQLVTFAASGDGLTQIGTDASSAHTGFQSKTKGGEAVATFAVTDSGTAVVIAVIGSQTAVSVIVSSAGSSEAMADEEASVGCLSNLAGFATWACGVESSASEIFGLVSGRGATALHLWNGSAWVRYSVVDGTMVPGSSDFMVAENDILYISN